MVGEGFLKIRKILKAFHLQHTAERSLREIFGNFYTQIFLKLHFKWEVSAIDGDNEGVFSRKVRKLVQFLKKCWVDLSPGTNVAPKVGQLSFLHIMKSSSQTESESCYKLLYKTFTRFHLSLSWNCLHYTQERSPLRTPHKALL